MQAKRFWWSLVVWALLALGVSICFIVAAGICAPWILSTNTGRSWFLDQLNRRIPGHIELESLTLHWLAPCQATGVRLLDSNGDVIATIDRIETSSGLLELIQGQPLQEARLTGGALVLEIDRKGATSLERALGLSPGLGCRSPRPDGVELASELDHVEIEWTSKHGLGILVSSALCRQGAVQGSWRMAAETHDRVLSSWEADIDRVPAEILDSLASLKNPSLRGLLKLVIGDHLTLHSVGNSQGQGLLQGAFSLSSSHIEASWDISGSLLAPSAHLVRPAKIQLDRTSLQQFLRSRYRNTSIGMKTDLTLTISEATWDATEGPKFFAHSSGPAEISLDEHILRVQDSSLRLERLNEIWTWNTDIQGFGDTTPWSVSGDLQIAPLKGIFKGHGLPTWLLGSISGPKLPQKILGGDQLSFEFEIGPQIHNPWNAKVTIGGSQPSPFGLPLLVSGNGHLRDRLTSFDLEVSAPRLELRTSGSWNPGTEIQLNDSSGLVRWNAATVQGLGFRNFPGLGRQMVPIRLSMDPLKIDLCRGGLPTLRARLEGAAFELEQLKNPLQIANLQGKLALHPSDERASVQVTADLHSLGQPKTTFAVSGTARNLGEIPSFEGRLDCPAFPLGLIQAFYPEWGGLEDVLGSSLSIQADLTSQKGGAQGTFDLSLSGPGLQIALPLTWEETFSLLPSRIGSLFWKITPTQAAALGRWLPFMQRIELVQPFTLSGELSEFAWRRGRDPLPACAGVFRASPLLMRVPHSADPIALHDWMLTLSQDEEQPLTRALLRGKIEAAQDIGSVAAASSWNRHAAWRTFSLEAECKKLPIEVLYAFDPTGGAEVGAVLGSEVYARLNITPGEEVSKGWGLWLRSPFFGVTGTGWLRRDGSMGLTTPLLTAWTSHSLNSNHDLGDLTNMLGCLSPGQTIAASIQPESTRFSWSRPSIQTLSIANAVVDAGRLEFRPTELLRGMEQFLKRKGSDVAEIWLTPVQLSTEKDRAVIKRFDALINKSTPIALWGSVALSDGSLDMTMGFPAESLAGFLSSPIGSSGLFTINLQGTLEEPSVDWGAAATRLAVSAASKLNIGTMVFGSLIDRAFSKSVPPPTTTPFPWQQPQLATPGQKILRELNTSIQKNLPAAAELASPNFSLSSEEPS